ncbi:hypothetical protein MTO96_040168, partial [Rhipicephalus appendiculatus]
VQSSEGGDAWRERYTSAASTGLEINSGHRKCTLCGKVYQSEGQLSCHMLIYTGERPFQCGFYVADFKQKSALNLPMRCRTGKNPSSVRVKIEECSVWPEVPADPPAASVPPASSGQSACVSNQPCVLDSRASIFNINLRPHKCPHCDKSFKHLSFLQAHIRRHTHERPFACPYCPKAYSWKPSFNQHVRRHAGGNPYICQLCCMAFTCESTFTEHMQQHD